MNELSETDKPAADLAPWIYLAKKADRPKTQECGRGVDESAELAARERKHVS